MIVLFVALYVLICFLVGFLGTNRRIGYSFTVFLSIVLTPLLMALIFVLTEPRDA